MQPHSPVTPDVAARLDVAIAERAALNALTEEVATAALRNEKGAGQKLSAHRKKMADVDAAIGELELLLHVAEKTDARAAADEQHRKRLDELAQFEQIAKAKQRAVEIYCRAAEVAAKAYLDVLDTSLQMDGWIPAGTSLQRGGLSPHTAEALILNGAGEPVAIATNTETIAASELQRHARITRVGNSGAMPGARALSPMVMQNPEAVEPWPSSNQRITAAMVAQLRSQIDALHRREVAAIEGRTQEAA